MPHFGLLLKHTQSNEQDLCTKGTILYLAAILDFGTETEMVSNLDVLEYKNLALFQFSQLFLNLNNRLVLFHQSPALFIQLDLTL